jgi:hypothetical protein
VQVTARMAGRVRQVGVIRLRSMGAGNQCGDPATLNIQPSTSTTWRGRGVFIDQTTWHLVDNFCEDQSLHLEGNQRNVSVEKGDDIKKTTYNVLRNKHGGVLVLWITFPLDVPIFNGADDVGFIGRAKLDFHLVAPLRFRVLKEEIKSPRPWLNALLCLSGQVRPNRELMDRRQ